jgi:hypothetical protein
MKQAMAEVPSRPPFWSLENGNQEKSVDEVVKNSLMALVNALKAKSEEQDAIIQQQQQAIDYQQALIDDMQQQLTAFASFAFS